MAFGFFMEFQDYKLAKSKTAISNVNRMAPIVLIIFISLIQCFPDSFERLMEAITPMIPPKELVIISVISLAPMAKINCTASNKRLVQMIGANCFSSGLSSHKICSVTFSLSCPYGIYKKQCIKKV